MTHGSMEKAGKVRKATLEVIRALGITPTVRKRPCPRMRWRELYFKRVVKGYRIGQPPPSRRRYKTL